MLSIRVNIEDLEPVRQRLSVRIDGARQQLVQQAAYELAREVAATVPVRSGETRRAWENETERVSSREPTQAGSSSNMTIGVDVPQMRYIEYGTRRMMPRATVRRAILWISRTVNTLFHLGD